MNYINSGQLCILWFITTAYDYSEPFTVCSVYILSDLLLNFASILTGTTNVSLALTWQNGIR